MLFNTCPKCGHVFVVCQVYGCDNYAEYMGWHIRLEAHMKMCKEHTYLLSGHDRFIDLHRNDDDEEE